MSEMSENTKLETQNYKVFSNVVFHYLCKKCGKFADKESGSNDYAHQCGISKTLNSFAGTPEKKLVWVYYTAKGKEIKNWQNTPIQKFRTQENRIDWKNWELVN